MKTYVIEYQDPRNGSKRFTFFKSKLEDSKLLRKIEKLLDSKFSYWTLSVSIYSMTNIEDWVKNKIENAEEVY